MVTRRKIIGLASAVLVAGCAGTGPSPTQDSPVDRSEQSSTTTEAVYCSESDVKRPPASINASPSGKPYPEAPLPLDEDSVREFLNEFETAYARNETIQDQSVSSVNIEIQGGFDVEAVDQGFLAHGNIQVMYTKDGGEQTPSGDKKYRVNYFVSTSAVLRTESDFEDLDPREEEDSKVVACFK